jgi:hypothetical protein
VTSALASSALSRRYLLGPLIALALVGANPSETPAPAAGGSPATASPSPSGVTTVGRKLLLAHDAEGIYYVDNLVYAAGEGVELTALQGIEKRVEWGGEVIVQLPAKVDAGSQVLILRAPLPEGGSLCIAEVSEVQDANTYYARVDGKCPPRKKGMPGWSTDESAGWGS